MRRPAFNPNGVWQTSGRRIDDHERDATMKCQKQVVYRERMNFDYSATFIDVEVRRYDSDGDNDVVIEQEVSEYDSPVLRTREVLNGYGYSDADLQRKGIKAFDALKAEFGERFSTRTKAVPPLEF
jgi:hypothetical protein